jgi:PAS domain S-box-containing protein
MLSIENLRTVFGSAPNGCLVLYPDAPRFTIAYANQVYLDAVRRSDDIIGQGVMEAFPESSWEEGSSTYLESSLQEVMAQRTAHRTPLFRYDVNNFETDTNEVHFWTCDTYPLLNDFDSIEYIVRIPTDVTQLIPENIRNGNAGNLQLKDSENPLFVNSPDAVFTVDLCGNFLTVNRRLVEITEFPEEELLKRSYKSFVHPTDQQLVADHFERARNGEIGHFEARALSARAKGSLLKVTYLPILINNEVTGVYIIAKDITDIKKAEKKLEAYNQRISNILESVTDGFLALDHNFTVTYWNKEAERILLKSREEAIGKNLWDIYPQAFYLKFYSEYQRSLAENVSVQFQEFLREINGWLEVTVYPSEDGLSVFFKDITDRIKGEEQLKQAKEQYQNLFDLSPLPNWVYDMETLAFLDVNKAAVEQYGYSRDEFLSKSLRDIRPAEDIKELLEVIKTDVITNHNSKSVARHVKKSGEVIAVEVKGATISFQGRIARLVLVIDITERLRAARELSISEQRFKALVQEGSDLIHIIDALGHFKYVSPNAHMQGLSRHIRVGDKAFNSVIEEDREEIVKAFSNLAKGECLKLPPFRYADQENKIHWMETILTNLIDDPAVEGVVANTRDITERINYESQIKESIERYNIVSKATSDAIYEWNLLKQSLKWSQGFEVLFGHDYSSSDADDRWLSRLHPEDKAGVLKFMNNAFRAKQPKITQEYRFRCADGSYKFVLDRSYLIYNELGKPIRIIGAMQDITERLNYIRKLEETNKKLTDISWLQCHVVRAPLAQIMSLAELLNYDEACGEKKELLNYLRDSAAELDEVVREIIERTEGI